MLTVYGIKNCDTVKKARRWLEQQSIDYRFHDFREDGISKKQLDEWLKQLGRDRLVNKRSTTWRQLSDKEKAITTDKQAIDLLYKNPTLIKRPVIEANNLLEVGFNDSIIKKLQ